MSGGQPWRVGVEVELLAPPGKSRHDLALSLAALCGGSVKRFFHPQSEPSQVPGSLLFHNLTLGFQVLDSEGRWLASCVDDLTLQGDLRRESAPKDGWYRILSDDKRLLHLVNEHADPGDNLTRVLAPIARLFGTDVLDGPNGIVKVNDRSGASVAMAAPLPGERERPCELIAAPCDSGRLESLDRYLAQARDLGFTLPKEGATHLHFDATALQVTNTFANLVHLLDALTEPLKRRLNCNPSCVRLGPWPAQLKEIVSAPDFRDLDWPEARARLRTANLSKFCDFNLLNCVEGRPQLNTIEIRILPSTLDIGPIRAAASLFVMIFAQAMQADALDSIAIAGIQRWLEGLPD